MTPMNMPLGQAMNTMTLHDFCAVLAGYLRDNEVFTEDPRDRNLDIKDVARLIGISVSSVRRLISDGVIPDGETSIGRGGRKLWSYRSIQGAILQHQKKLECKGYERRRS